MVIKFTPQGRVEMVFGRKQEASRRGHGAAQASEPPAPRARRIFSPGNRRRLGQRG